MITTIALMVYFILGWAISKKLNKYSWVDFYWSSSFLIVIFLLLQNYQGLNHVVLSGLVALWSIRLSTMLYKRISKEKEDPRYINLKNRWAENTDRNFLILYIFEGFLTLVLCIPLYLSAQDPSETLSVWNYIGITFFVFSLLGELLADNQLAQFKKDNAGQKKVCNVGLWRYSRHPNYFFESMIWLSYGVFSIGTDKFYLAFIPFVIMYLFLTRITGIPYSEKQSLKSRGDLYIEYQNKTNAFFPWFPKEN